MLYTISGLFLVIGLAIGGGSASLVLRTRVAQAREQAFAQVGAERATLSEQLRGSQYRTHELSREIEQERGAHYAVRLALQDETERRATAEAHSQRAVALASSIQGQERVIEGLRGEHNRLHTLLKVEGERRATAETRMQRIGELEQCITERDNLITDLQGNEIALNAEIAARQAQRDEEQKAAAEKVALLQAVERKFADAFTALSADALQKNNGQFLDLAQQAFERSQEAAKGELARRQQAIDGNLERQQHAINTVVSPVRDSLREFGTKVSELEVKRETAYTELQTQIRALQEGQSRLQTETANLVTALRSPATRGRWGELQLRNVVEMAGMLQGYDFELQESVATEDGVLRPDMIVRLPGQRTVVVDSKVPLEAYLNAMDATDAETRSHYLRGHARQVREHITRLSEKRYWEQFPSSPEFVILFLPGEAFFSVALEHDKELIEVGAKKKVILATPTTLVALLRVVQHGFQQERIAQNAEEIGSLGRELYKRLCTLAEHWTKVGRSLEGATKAYNEATGSLDSRVFTQARRFEKLGASEHGMELPELAQVSLLPRVSHAPEIQDVADGD